MVLGGGGDCGKGGGDGGRGGEKIVDRGRSRWFSKVVFYPVRDDADPVGDGVVVVVKRLSVDSLGGRVKSFPFFVQSASEREIFGDDADLRF